MELPVDWHDIQAVLDGRRDGLLRVLQGSEPPDEPPLACPVQTLKLAVIQEPPGEMFWARE